jgi:membrane-bound lytic murein transglycosylase D
MMDIKKISQGKGLQLSGIGFFTVLVIILALLGKESKNRNTQQKDEIGGTETSSSPVMPEKLDFCDEEVPLDYYDVYESLEKELIVNTYYHSQTLLQLKKAPRYFAVIEPILKKNDVPGDFKYLALAESGFNFTVSPVGAAGFWQLLKSTAEEYGLEVNEVVDERYNLEKATEVACKYLKESYAKFGNWTMVAASYNVGRKGVEKQIERQKESNYYNLLFNEETARYIYRILAIKIVMEDPEKYGFTLSSENYYKPIPFQLVTVSSSIPDIGDFARQNNTNYKMLKYLNPWLRDNMLQNTTGKEYVIKIPVTRTIDTETGLIREQ